MCEGRIVNLSSEGVIRDRTSNTPDGSADMGRFHLRAYLAGASRLPVRRSVLSAASAGRALRDIPFGRSE
jgi:hypothetical protein